MTENINKTAPNPDTVHAFKGRVRRLAGIRRTNEYVIKVRDAEQVITVTKFRANIFGHYDSWTSRKRDRQPNENNPSTKEELFNYTELSVRKKIGRNGVSSLLKKSGILHKMKDSPFFIPVSNPGDTIPTETDFHTDMVLLSHANWRNRLSPKRQNTWDERRAKRRTRKKA